MLENSTLPAQTIALLYKYLQALHNDTLVFFLAEPTLTTEVRKIAVLTDIELIKEQLVLLEKLIKN